MCEENLIELYSREIEQYRGWLKLSSKKHLKRWECLLVSNPQAAICESLTQQMLSDQDIIVNLNEDISVGGPDFLCSKNNKNFYVEATCISKDAATRESGLSDKPQHKASNYALLTGKIFGEICNKTPQCSGLKYPCLIAIGTLHFQAGCLCFNKHSAEDLLTGTPFITVPIDMRTGQAIREPYEATSLQSAVFVRPIKTSPQSMEFARNPISSVLLCPFATRPTKVVGVLHPNPNYIFDRTLLPEIEFGRLVEGYKANRFEVEWI
jgi:hypothetical protein